MIVTYKNKKSSDEREWAALDRIDTMETSAQMNDYAFGSWNIRSLEQNDAVKDPVQQASKYKLGATQFI